MLDARYWMVDGGCWLLDMALLGNRGVKPLLQLEDTGRQPASADGGRGEGAEAPMRNFVFFLSRRKPSAKADVLFCGYLSCKS